MTINPPDVITCPSCKTEQLRCSLGSYNTFDALYYSDGTMLSSMYTRYPYFVKCPGCGAFFKIDSSVITGRTDFDDTRPHVDFLSVEEGLSAIRGGLFGGAAEGSAQWENEMTGLRIELWWAFNERLRKSNGGDLWKSEAEKSDYINNCRELLRLTENAADDEGLLRRAELLRNIGEFDACRETLAHIKDTVEYGAYIGTIKKACDAGNTVTVMVC